MTRVGFLWIALLGCSSQPKQANTCTERGGSWMTSARDRTLPGACVMPASDADKPCTKSSDCSIHWCQCPDSSFADGPHTLDNGAVTTGTCARFPAHSGAGFMCVVEDGRVRRHGIIVD